MPSPEESGISLNRQKEVRGTYAGGFPKPERVIRGALEVLRVLRGCAVARLRRCAVVRESLLYSSVLIIMITMYMLVSMPHLRRCSPHVNRLVYEDVRLIGDG